MALNPHEEVPKHQQLDFTFELSPTRKGKVTASIVPNEDATHWGCDLLFADQPNSAWLGYPVCEATVQSTGARGYGSMYGWVQLATVPESDTNTTMHWHMDPIPAANDVNIPFVWFGPEPRLFDAPIQVKFPNLDWGARSFLVSMPDCLLTKEVRPILGFEWGFWKRDGNITIKPLQKLHLEIWDSHLPLMREKFQGWTFVESKDVQK